MKVPDPRRLSSGRYYIQLRLDGKSYSFTESTAKECRDAARTFKSDFLAGRVKNAADKPWDAEPPTLRKAFDLYLADKSNTLSPATIRFYRIVQRNRFPAVMSRPIAEIGDNEWQGIVNQEAKRYAPKTLRNSYSAVKTVIHSQTDHLIPDVSFPGKVGSKKKFLTPEEITKFVDEVKGTKYAVPLLLALSSMRISEIDALDWADIPPNPDFVRVSGARVLDENNDYVEKAQNKNETSARNVPILIPALSEAIERDRQPSGPLLPCSQNNLRLACHRICQKAGITDVGVHELRHSFASLAYHLKMPEQIAMEIGGWADATTMHKIYTHIAQSDIERYRNAMSDFYSGTQKPSVKSASVGPKSKTFC